MLPPFTIAQACPNHGLARRPRTAPDLWGQAGALLQSIVEHHPLVDGNRRLGWVATAVFLEISGVEATTDPFRITETLARLVLVPWFLRLDPNDFSVDQDRTGEGIYRCDTLGRRPYINFPDKSAWGIRCPSGPWDTLPQWP